MRGRAMFAVMWSLCGSQVPSAEAGKADPEDGFRESS